MHRKFEPKGRSLGASADLTLLAPIKPGFIESLESVSYRTRIKRVLDALHLGRSASHEYAAARLLSDAVERVGVIQSVRVAVLEPENKVLLAVSFDSSWQAYLRVLWDKVGTLLDLIFCGTEDYVTAADHSYEEWCVWARRVQVETGFFYGPTEGSARDLFFHRRVERMTVRGAGSELRELRAVLPGAEQAAAALVVPLPDPPPDEPPVQQAAVPMRAVNELFTLGLQGLSGLYRLADLHRPGTCDGDVLRRAAIDLLREFVLLCADGAVDEGLALARAGRFARPLAWLADADDRIRPLQRPLPPPPGAQPDRVSDALLQRLQGGIVRPYEGVTHGALLLLAFADAAAGAAFLAWVKGRVSRGTDTGPAPPQAPHCNLGLTPAGLRALGLDEDTLALFPEEFRQGMAARAGLLGDVRNNHPRRWRLPRRATWPAEPAGAEAPEVELDGVHAVLQLRCHAPALPQGLLLGDPGHLLRGFVSAMVAALPGTRLLAWQEMSRELDTQGQATLKGHFGYRDGMGQPDIEAPAQANPLNRVHLGEAVWGHDNLSDLAPDPADPGLPQAVRARLPWLADGSFLALRKYRQFADRLDAAVAAAVAQMRAVWPAADERALADTAYAKLMGRHRDGTPLVAHAGSGPDSNVFSYDADPAGSACPLHAHVRLAHPRRVRSGAARPPRLLRRGMSYGLPVAAGTAADRGVVFIAYNASLGEQFEVVQRWLAGGNSTGSSSGQSCPVVGVPENGQVRHFRFEHSEAGVTAVIHVPLEQPTPLFDEPAVSTRLEWGLYLFAPSHAVIERLRLHAAAVKAAPVPWLAQRGRELLAGLDRVRAEQGVAAAVQAWKQAIEDPDAIDRLDAAALWAAIRQDHGGVLATPYGVLVARRELIEQVLLDEHALYSISGQRERMKRSFGDIFLGMDDGADYRRESGPVNAALQALNTPAPGQRSAYAIALDAAQSKLKSIFKQAGDLAYVNGASRWEVAFDAREVIDEVLIALCNDWFGLKDSTHFKPGGTDWHWQEGQAPLYPGHFTALSRYMFQPHPGPMPEELSLRYGQALMQAMRAFVAGHRAAGTLPMAPAHGSAAPATAPVAAAVFGHPELGHDDDWVARTLLGVLMGFIAPIIGATLNVLREWQCDGQFATLREQLAGRSDPASAAAVLARPLWAAASMRPMPQLIWRTARQAHRLGGADGVDVRAGDKLVVALVSGTQQTLEQGSADHTLMFGGDRSATPHPTHACPGLDAGTQALLGTVAALVAALPESGQRLRCSPATWGFLAEGPVESPAGLRHLRAAPSARVRRAPPPQRPLPALPEPRRSGLVLAVGDSWLHSPYADGNDLRQQLQRCGWTVPGALCSYLSWGKAETLARKLDALGEGLLRMRAEHPALALRGVLVSAGGNDSTGATFLGLLNPDDNSDETLPLNEDQLDQHMGRLRARYEAVLQRVFDVLGPELRPEAPILLHGYDHSQLPPGATTLAHWFRLPFEKRGYDPVADRAQELACMRRLIERFNEELRDLAAQPRWAGKVRWVDLQGTIAAHWTPPEQAWRDDLHPHPEAFIALADRIDRALVPA